MVYHGFFGWLVRVRHPKPDWRRYLTNQKSRKQPSLPNAAYGPTKAAVHWLTKRIDAEEDSIAALVIDPGYVEIFRFYKLHEQRC
jgi:NAD(P)-dependent dehydrogenase (short-subunit alcohol dehydrogenase family)